MSQTPSFPFLKNRPKAEFKVVEVKSLYEVRRLLNDLDKITPNTTVKTVMSGKSAQGVMGKYKVEAPIECDRKSMLITGMNMVKAKYDAIEKMPEAAKILDVNQRMWIDDLIERRFGGKREGLRIKWTVAEGTFYYDPFTKKLTESVNATGN